MSAALRLCPTKVMHASRQTDRETDRRTQAHTHTHTKTNTHTHTHTDTGIPTHRQTSMHAYTHTNKHFLMACLIARTRLCIAGSSGGRVRFPRCVFSLLRWECSWRQENNSRHQRGDCRSRESAWFHHVPLFESAPAGHFNTSHELP